MRSVAQFPFGDKSTSSRLLRMPSVCSFRSLLHSSSLGKGFTVFPCTLSLTCLPLPFRLVLPPAQSASPYVPSAACSLRRTSVA